MRGSRYGSDDELMLAAAEGSEEAFAVLMERHRDWVRWLLRAFVRDADQVEDLAQETFARVYRYRQEYIPRGNFVAWLKRIAVNQAKDFLRRQKTRAESPLEDEEALLTVDRRYEPMAVLANGCLQEELREAVQCLPDEQRLPVIMHYFGDMTLPDIAWAMRCPVGTVKSRLFYGLRRVRRMLADRWTEGDEGATL
jgi:RNA polymerase sigma-70 factor (ECF subfamily)